MTSKVELIALKQKYLQELRASDKVLAMDLDEIRRQLDESAEASELEHPEVNINQKLAKQYTLLQEMELQKSFWLSTDGINRRKQLLDEAHKIQARIDALGGVISNDGGV